MAMRPLDEIGRKAARKAKCGKGSGRLLSRPVLRLVEGDGGAGRWCLAFFVQEDDAKSRRRGRYRRPSEWVAMDAVDGRLVLLADTSEREFSGAPYDDALLPGNGQMLRLSEGREAEAYRDRDAELLDRARAPLASGREPDAEAYAAYMSHMLAAVPRDWRGIYRKPPEKAQAFRLGMIGRALQSNRSTPLFAE